MSARKENIERLPIGIFDSGIGGLTVVRAIKKLLPCEDIIYLGDTARVPYGTKSPETVKRFAQQDAAFLYRQNIKAIVVACNTVSSWALPELERLYDMPIFGVIEPGVCAAISRTKNHRIGVIGTTATINSNTYTVAIKARDKGARVFARPCPLLVPLVEEGWVNHPVTRQVLTIYLSPLIKNKIDTLILGCTHYPLLKPVIKKIVGDNIALVDSAQVCAQTVKQKLGQLGFLKQSSNSEEGNLIFYTTDAPEHFTRLAKRFLGYPVKSAWKAEL
ncbi:MAG: glutamate racemase [Verrucomicrobiia bacterium]